MELDTIPRTVRFGVVIALLVVAAAAPVAVAVVGPEEEPNDGQEDAQEVTVGEEVTGTLDNGDVDWFKFTAESGTAITITGATDGVGTTNFDLVDSRGNTLAGVSGLVNENGEVGTTGTYTGTYYLRVERRFTDRGGDYNFTVVTANSDGFEPNEKQANATDVTDGEEITGELTIGDTDWFNVTANEGETFDVSAFADSNGTTNVQVYARNGTLLVGEDAISGRSVTVNGTAPYTGEYSLRVSSRFGDYGAAYDLTVDLPGDPPSGADGKRSAGPRRGDGGLPVLPIGAGVLVVLVILLVVLRFRDADDETE